MMIHNVLGVLKWVRARNDLKDLFNAVFKEDGQRKSGDKSIMIIVDCKTYYFKIGVV